MFWLRYLSNKASSICNKTGGSFSPVLRKWELSLVSITSWLLTNFLINIGIQNNFVRTRYQEVLENNHFSENTKPDKTDKGHQIRTVHHLNESFQVVFSNKTDQVLMSIWQNSKDFPVSCPNIIRFYMAWMVIDSIVKASISSIGECFWTSQMSHMSAVTCHMFTWSFVMAYHYCLS